MVNGSDRPRIFDSTLSRRISPALAVCVRPSRNADIVSPANVLIFIVSPFLYVRACVASMGIGGPLQLVNQLRFLSLGQKRRRQTVLCEGGDLCARQAKRLGAGRSEEHTSELQSLMRISYAVFCLKNKHHKT